MQNKLQEMQFSQKRALKNMSRYEVKFAKRELLSGCNMSIRLFNSRCKALPKCTEMQTKYIDTEQLYQTITVFENEKEKHSIFLELFDEALETIDNDEDDEKVDSVLDEIIYSDTIELLKQLKLPPEHLKEFEQEKNPEENLQFEQ
jgi:hypothetical protein